MTLARALMLSVALFAVGCSSPTPKDPTYSWDVGPEGGTFETTDDEGFALYVPPDVIETPMKLTVTVKAPTSYPNSGELLSNVYELGPDGTQFARDIKVITKAKTRPPASDNAVVAYLDTSTNTWVELENSREMGDVSAGTARVIGSTNHFSAFTTWHVVNKFPEECRTLLVANALGMQEANTLTIPGATLLYRQQYGGIEYGSMWRIDQPNITINGVGMLDGTGRWGWWKLGQPGSGWPKPVPTGFPISSKRFSINVPIASLVAQGAVQLSLDDYCPANLDVGFECIGACAGTGGGAGGGGGGAGGGSGGGAGGGSGGSGGAGGGGATMNYPCQVGSTAVASASPRALAVAGNTLLGADDLGGTAAFSTWNITNPLTPTLLDSLDLSGYGDRQIAFSGTTAFVTDNLRIVAISFADPANISIVGTYSLDADVALKTALGNPVNGVKARGIAISGNFAYVAASDRGFVVVDITDPTAMSRAAYTTDGSVGAGDVVISGTRAYVVSNENQFCIPGPCVPANVRGFLVYDISTPTAPTRLVHFDMPNTTPNAMAINGNTAYVISIGGLNINAVNITNPAAPVAIGTPFQTNGGGYDARIANNRLWVSSNSAEAHMQVYALTDPANPNRLSDETVAATGGGYAIATGATHAYVGSIGKISVIDLRCPAQ
jgi:hypothetical protein